MFNLISSFSKKVENEKNEREEEMRSYKENSQFEEETVMFQRKLEEFDRTKQQIKTTYDMIMNDIRDESVNFQTSKETYSKIIPETRREMEKLLREGILSSF